MFSSSGEKWVEPPEFSSILTFTFMLSSTHHLWQGGRAKARGWVSKKKQIMYWLLLSSKFVFLSYLRYRNQAHLKYLQRLLKNKRLRKFSAHLQLRCKSTHYSLISIVHSRLRVMLYPLYSCLTLHRVLSHKWSLWDRADALFWYIQLFRQNQHEIGRLSELEGNEEK